VYLSRRRFIQAAGAGVAALSVPPLFPQQAWASGAGEPVIVMLFLRGGADALTHVIPHPDRLGGAAYKEARGAIQLPYQNAIDPAINHQLLTPLHQNFRNGQTHPADFFAMNSTLNEMLPLYNQSHRDKPKLAVIHAAGNTETTNRSHFSAEDAMERGVKLPTDIGDGWLTRAVELLAQKAENDVLLPLITTPLTGVSLAANPIGSLAGGTRNLSLALASLKDFGLIAPNKVERKTTLASMFDKFPLGPPNAASSIAQRAGHGLYTALDQLTDELLPTPATLDDYQRAGLAEMPVSMYGRLRDAARMIKEPSLGVRAVAIDFEGGWDYHTNILQQTPMYTQRLAATLSRFYDDLADGNETHCAADRTVTIVTSEFGRNVGPNGANTEDSGTDHGHGGIMYVVGKDVVGGRVLSRQLADPPANEIDNIGWPGLAPDLLEEGRDLKVTIDFRDVFADVVGHHYGLSPAEVQGLFPSTSGYAPKALPDSGLF